MIFLFILLNLQIHFIFKKNLYREIEILVPVYKHTHKKCLKISFFLSISFFNLESTIYKRTNKQKMGKKK